MSDGLAYVGGVVDLALQLGDGAVDQFPQAFIYAADDGTLLSTKSLTHVAKGLYTNETYVMPDESAINIVYEVFSDSGHTTENTFYPRQGESIYRNDTQGKILSDATPFAGASIAAIKAKTDNLPADPASASTITGQFATLTSTLNSGVSSILAAIAALNNLSQAGVQAAMTAQGYTTARAILLDNLNASISSVISAIAALNNVSVAQVQTAAQAALTAQGYTSVRALLLDNLDASISSVLTAIGLVPAAVDVVLTAAHGAGPWGSGGDSCPTLAEIVAAFNSAVNLGAQITGLVESDEVDGSISESDEVTGEVQQC